MAHPFAGVRQSKVEHGRVGKMTGGYDKSGDVAQDRKLMKQMIKGHESRMHMDGGKVSARQDRPARASGGRVGKKLATNVIINISSKDAASPSAPSMSAAVPPVPPVQRPAPLPPPMPGGPSPAGPGPGIPGPGGMMPPPLIRASGGRVKKPGPGFTASERLKTRVQHAAGKQDQKDVGRGKVVTYAAGGPIEAPKGKGGRGPKFHGGARSGIGRLEKAHRAAAKHG